MTNRLVSDVPGCSLLLDATGTNYALSHGRDPETGAAKYKAVDAVWTYAFDHAQYVWLSGLNHHRVAWTPALERYFGAHFTRILNAGRRGCAVPAHRPETGKLTTGGRDKCRTRSQR